MTLLVALLACGTPAPEPAQPAAAEGVPEPAPFDPSYRDASYCGPGLEGACVSEAHRVRKDPEAWQALLRPSCERGHLPSCTQLGTWLAEDRLAPEDQVERLFRYACTGGDGGGCLKLADYVDGEEKRVTLERGCTLGVRWACIGAGLPLPEPSSAGTAASRKPGSQEWLELSPPPVVTP